MPDILNVVDVHTNAELVYQLVSTPTGIARWWSPHVSGSCDIGDSVTILFGEHWKVVLESLEQIPNQLAHYRVIEHDSDEWPGTELIFRLKQNEDWTILEFDHRKWCTTSDFFRFCSTKWSTFLLSIKQAAETGTGTPYPEELKIGRNG